VSGYSLPRPIAEDDDPSSFDSGEPSLDEYLRKRALGNHVQGASRCFVTCRDGRVVGYYALASASVQHGDVTGKVRRNMPDPVPVILLSRLAVDRKEQGSGLGKNLLRDAILRSVEASEIIGVRALLVHALNDTARAFYAHFDFEPSPTDPLHLLLLIKDARSAVGEQRHATRCENQRMDAQEPHPLGVDPAAVGVALAWVERLREGDIDALWSRTSHDYRLALTQWWVTANPGVCDDPAVAGKSRDVVAEEISTGHHPLFDHLRGVLARDLRASVADLEDLELAAGTAARVVSPGVELIALFVADDVPDGAFAPGATARAVTVAVAQEDGQWLVTGLNCVAVPGWPPTWSPGTANLED
jgi:predicted N-acetyltransferase YhbS